MATIFWHRRDLRNFDNAGLYRALEEQQEVQPIFIFDEEILDRLADKDDARLSFIHDAIIKLAADYAPQGASLRVYHGKPLEVWPQILKEFAPTAVYTNRDYEPYALERDEAVQQLVETTGASWNSYKDHVIFEGHEVLKNDGTPYTVFTPYMRKWRAKLDTRLVAWADTDGRERTISFYLKPYPCEKYFKQLRQQAKPFPIPTLSELGFSRTSVDFPPTSVARSLIRNYDATRDFPAQTGTSRLGVHFRHGTISIREKALRAMKLNDIYVNELVWRDFYSQILQHFPHVVEGPFRPAYAGIPWENNEDHFEAWCEGRTGVPIVDAGMRELLTTGHMHNRVRMVVASYLTKHLLIDWRWGEAHFARYLLDFDLASNNGGWQWAASCGTDAQPYFRIFNAESQQKKFDPQFKYIKKWIPEFGTDKYPDPLVQHKFGRERAIAVYKQTLAEARGSC